MVSNTMLPLDTSVEAEYTDGFILSETQENDVSLYFNGKNTFYDILEKQPEAIHGPMVRFTAYWKNAKYDIDWLAVPKNARPIRYRHGYSSIDGSGNVGSGWSGITFGYQWTDEQGNNQQEVVEL